MVLTPIIKEAADVLIIGHMRPDGDCLGAGLALRHVLQKAGKNADFVCDSDIPQSYSFLQGFGDINKQSLAGYDTVFAVDCGDDLRLGRFAPFLKKARTSVNIDHHITNNMFAKVNLVQQEASSTCEILARYYIDEGLMDKECAGYLYVGLSSDTGHFMHNNTTAAVFRLAAELIDLGADAFETVRNLYKSNTVNKTMLAARIISSARFFGGGIVCVSALTAKDLADCGCTLSDTESLIDHIINIKNVEAAACLTESGKNGYKVSLRSKTHSILAAAVSFGGGGHKNAAGCMVCGLLEDAIAKVAKALTDCFDLNGQSQA